MKIVFILLIAATLGAAAPGAGVRSAVVPPASGTTLQSPDGTQISWDDLLHRYAGKVVYLDIWASWCGPCRHETPFYEALRAKFAKDPVVFLSISIDSDPEDWKGALGDGQPNPDSFLLLDGHHSSLNAVLHINGVPRYALLDRSGRFVDKDAPFPSTDEIEGRIRKLVEQSHP
ncbi:TlpA family protein disulfide reductase [Dinghuibacter silviterrae]|uniref:TlpA family protein disulfide reductase n=1 Tax=Dinghuibacter silviterrae TaxID=1539049 RepID=UPI0010624E07|nr:TlpA disulfide reductase family protein [Dinghuibacter silviterrae]